MITTGTGKTTKGQQWNKYLSLVKWTKSTPKRSFNKEINIILVDPMGTQCRARGVKGILVIWPEILTIPHHGQGQGQLTKQ